MANVIGAWVGDATTVKRVEGVTVKKTITGFSTGVYKLSATKDGSCCWVNEASIVKKIVNDEVVYTFNAFNASFADAVNSESFWCWDSTNMRVEMVTNGTTIYSVSGLGFIKDIRAINDTSCFALGISKTYYIVGNSVVNSWDTGMGEGSTYFDMSNTTVWTTTSLYGNSNIRRIYGGTAATVISHHEGPNLGNILAISDTLAWVFIPSYGLYTITSSGVLTQIASGLTFANKLAKIDENTIYAAGGSYLYRVTSAGGITSQYISSAVQAICPLYASASSPHQIISGGM